MEVRAHFIAVGVFFLLTIAGIMLAIMWLASEDTGSQMDEYDISFKESVSGLSVGNAVLFSGIRVGNVSQIKISDTEPGAVRVRVSINGDTPVREDSIAQLELRGLTGVSVVSITGGTAGSPLVNLRDHQVGHIKSQASPLAAVMKDASNISSRVDRVLANLENFTSEENQESFRVIISSFAELSSSIASRTDAIEASIDRIDKVTADLSVLMDNANSALVQYDTAGSNINALTRTLNTEVSGFSREILPQIRQLIGELSNLTHVFSRVGRGLESDPKQYLFGDTVKEYAP